MKTLARSRAFASGCARIPVDELGRGDRGHLPGSRCWRPEWLWLVEARKLMNRGAPSPARRAPRGHDRPRHQVRLPHQVQFEILRGDRVVLAELGQPRGVVPAQVLDQQAQSRRALDGEAQCSGLSALTNDIAIEREVLPRSPRRSRDRGLAPLDGGDTPGGGGAARAVGGTSAR
jgi:hypothetical protein